MKQGNKILIGVCLVSLLISIGSISAVAAVNPSLLGISGDMVQDQDQDCDQDQIQDQDQDQDQDCDQDQIQDQEQDQDCEPT